MSKNVYGDIVRLALVAALCAATVNATQSGSIMGRKLMASVPEMATTIEVPAIPREDENVEARSRYIDAHMVAEMEAAGVHDVLEAEYAADHINPSAYTFTQFMGTAELAVSDFLDSGFLLANLDSESMGFIAAILNTTRFILYVSLCLMVGALLTATGMILDRLVIGVLTRRCEITVGKKGTIAFLFIFGVLSMGCTVLFAYWLYQGPVWLPFALLGAILIVLLALHKSAKGKKWRDELIECLYLIIAPKLFVWKYILDAIGKRKISDPYDV